jgi:hypothetical protein
MKNKSAYILEQGSTVSFTIQNGPIKEVGVNGCQIDDVIDWAKRKIEEFNGRFPCPENHAAMVNLQAALDNLEFRRKNREARKVEGTSAA